MKKEGFLKRSKEKAVQLWQWMRDTRLAKSAVHFFNVCEQHSFLTQCVLVLLMRLILDVVYITVLQPNYAYTGFTYSIQPLFYLSTWLALVIFTPFHVRLSQNKAPSALIITFLDYLFFIPLTSYCGCSGSDVPFLLIALIYWAAMLLFQFCLPILELKRLALHHSRFLLIGLTVVSCIFILYISGRYTGFRFTLDFVDVYGIRLEARTYQIPTLFNYLLSAMTIVMTILLLYWLTSRKWLITAALCIVYIFLFSISAQKSQFFLLILILGCLIFYREWMLRWAGGFLVLFCMAGLAEEKLFHTVRLLGIFILRMLYLPVQICQQYGEFFQKNPQNLFREGIMGKLSFGEIYSMQISRIVGEFRGHPLEGANSGLLGDLFANFPTVPGVILLPLILVICFRLLDMTASYLPIRIKIPICFYFACCFLSVFWSTVLLTNGFLLTCLLLYIYPNEEGLSHA